MSALGAVSLVGGTPFVAEAARLTFVGQVALSSNAAPVADASVTITFHGHEAGIHEYTTRRQVSTQTDAAGEFEAIVKVPSDRYIWTHATVEIAETEDSKATTTTSVCHIDNPDGGHCQKDFRVSPLSRLPLRSNSASAASSAAVNKIKTVRH